MVKEVLRREGTDEGRGERERIVYITIYTSRERDRRGWVVE